MNRRDAALSLLALGTAPLVCLAQQPGRDYRIGVLLSGPEPAMRRYLDALRERLAEHGFVEGRNLRITLQVAAESQDQQIEAARTLLASAPDVFFTFAAPQTLAVQRLKPQAPIVFTTFSKCRLKSASISTSMSFERAAPGVPINFKISLLSR